MCIYIYIYIYMKHIVYIYCTSIYIEEGWPPGSSAHPRLRCLTRDFIIFGIRQGLVHC